VGSIPIRTRATEQVLQGQPFSEAILTRALQTLGTELHAQADLTHSAAAKLHLADVLLKRVLAELAAPVNLNA
jgi:CO/xanthine dehydrogenase FAD-binding subunit